MHVTSRCLYESPLNFSFLDDAYTQEDTNFRIGHEVWSPVMWRRGTVWGDAQKHLLQNKLSTRTNKDTKDITGTGETDLTEEHVSDTPGVSDLGNNRPGKCLFKRNLQISPLLTSPDVVTSLRSSAPPEDRLGMSHPILLPSHPCIVTSVFIKV